MVTHKRSTEHMRYAVVDKMTVVWKGVPVPGSFVDCCLLHVGSGADDHAQLSLLLNGPTGLCFTCAHTSDAVVYKIFTCIYDTWISYINVYIYDVCHRFVNQRIYLVVFTISSMHMRNKDQVPKWQNSVCAVSSMYIWHDRYARCWGAACMSSFSSTFISSHPVAADSKGGASRLSSGAFLYSKAQEIAGSCTSCTGRKLPFNS